TLAWPTYLSVLLVAILLVPMLQAGYTSVPGQNPDGLLGVGVAELLQNTHPTGSDTDLPIDTMPLVWRSKYPIYYVLAGTSTLSGLEPIKVFAAEAAVLAALTAIAFMLLALYGLRAQPRAALLVMAMIGFNSLIGYLAGHPYHNQLWGTLALPMILLFGMRWLEMRSRADAALFALFTALGLSAYPLMVLFPALALAAGAIVLRRGSHTPRPRLRRPRTARSIALAVAVTAIAVPAALVVVLGVLEKSSSAASVLVSGGSLDPWRGDLQSYKAPGFFVGVPAAWGYLAAGLVLAAGTLGLRGVPPAWRAALGSAVLGGLAFALFFRFRDFGEYFHFKVLAFVAPMLLTAAAVWLAQRTTRSGRGARVALIAAAVFVGAQLVGLSDEIGRISRQVDRQLFDLRDAAKGLPAGASVRLDVLPDGRQLWAAYMLKDHPLSASNPLSGTTFPYARYGRKADYILADTRLSISPWPDADGPPIFDNGAFRVYRMRRDVPGPDTSSKRLVDSFSSGFK
ncbi:MAG: hypothetical protein H0U32_00925, partial [Thermoleophilaceae bacterium]|nr:hypothetical protein [Thermoleophilaceae bacterium]